MTTSSYRRRIRTRGFTLLELMFTLTMAAILMGLAIPTFRTMSASNRIITQANDMVAAVNFARSEAITRNSNIVFCRATSATATACAPSLANWTNWILRTPAGVVVRRGTVNTYGGSVRVNSDFILDAVTFASDGLARTGGGLVVNRAFTVCSSVLDQDNIRRIELGAGSRLSTTKSTGVC
jgi:type IV fimbrial biogenesis protein FimT